MGIGFRVGKGRNYLHRWSGNRIKKNAANIIACGISFQLE